LAFEQSDIHNDVWYFQEVGRQEEFMQTDNEQASFLHACSNVDMANCFSSDVNGALKQTEAYYVSANF
jgi:hypothetical protein